MQPRTGRVLGEEQKVSDVGYEKKLNNCMLKLQHI